MMIGVEQAQPDSACMRATPEVYPKKDANRKDDEEH